MTVAMTATHQDAPGMAVITAVPEVAADHPGLADDGGMLDRRAKAARGHRIGVSGERTRRENDRRSGESQTELTHDSPPERTLRLNQRVSLTFSITGPFRTRGVWRIYSSF